MMNDHGWQPLGVLHDDGRTVVSFAPLVDERKRCGCTVFPCRRLATQEDLLCDECRETCP